MEKIDRKWARKCPSGTRGLRIRARVAFGYYKIQIFGLGRVRAFVISNFSGSGSSGIAYHRAGFRVFRVPTQH